LIGAPRSTPVADLQRAVDIVSAQELIESSEAVDSCQRIFSSLAEAWERYRADLLVYASVLQRARHADSATVFQKLAAALRSGRAERRAMLADLDPTDLVHALPIWIGTLQDIEDLLPAVPALFDVVLLDEASGIDQPSAAPALLRGRKVVVAGDVHQIRLPEFRSDSALSDVLRRHDLEDMAHRLDLRRVSLLDLALPVAASVNLVEHHRSVPHLIEFSAERFYGGQIELVTRHPSNDHVDAIDTVRVDTHGEDVVDAEVGAVELVLRRLLDEGRSSVGIVTPFRVVADALEAMTLDRFSLDEIERLNLRIGTVHGFQGGERDVMIVVLGLADDDPPGRWRFVEDPNLFNVMITRARERQVVVTATQRPPPGLVRDYLQHAEHGPGPRAGRAVTPWVAALSAAFESRGVAARPGYPVGSGVIDAVLGDDSAAVGLVCSMHPDGERAHVDRHLALARSGWRLIEVLPGWFEDDADRAAEAILVRIDARRSGTSGVAG
jgi:hypothetical protein